MKFILDTDWIYKNPPVDFEENQYKLLYYFQKIADKLNNFELYPYFIEISLHLANIQTLSKENLLVKTNKKFRSNEDELLVTDLDFITPPACSEKEEIEIKKTLQFAAPKFQDYFNIAKSVWTLVYESTHVSIKKNKKIYLIHTDIFSIKTKVNYICGNTNLQRIQKILMKPDQKQEKFFQVK